MSGVEHAKRVIVIGSGFGGLAAALRARAAGHEVVLLERLEQLGGRARTFKRKGYTFDAGPTVITAPFLFEELFELFGKRLTDYVDMLPVEPWYRFEFTDGSHLNYGGTVADTLAEIERLSPEDVAGYRKLLAASQKIFDVGFNQLAHQPFHRIVTMVRQVPALLRLGCYRSVWQFTKKYLRDERLRRAFSIQPLLVGGNPFTTTSIYSLIHYLEREWGIHYPRGGTGALVAALESLLREEGVDVRCGADVARIEAADGRIRGVTLTDGTFLPADAVISNGDPIQVHRELLDDGSRGRWSDARLDKLEVSMGLYVLYFGTTRTYSDVQHHTILFGERYRELLDEVFAGPVVGDDLSLYLHRPTATDPSMAPAGHDAFYVLAPVPNLKVGSSWETQRDRIRERVLDILDERILPGLRDSMDVSFDLTPTEFERDYRSAHGAGFSLAPRLTQSAFFRFHNRSAAVAGLYFVGAGSHPGAGVPGVVSSAKVVERLLADDRARELAGVAALPSPAG